MIIRLGKTIVFVRGFKIYKLKHIDKKFFYSWENDAFAYNIWKKDHTFEQAINKVMSTIHREYYGGK